MRYIVIPITDAKFIFSEDELAHMRKSVDETQVIVHEGIMLDKRKAMGMNVLPSETNGQIEWTYPVYEYNTEELNNLLNSNNWSNNKN